MSPLTQPPFHLTVTHGSGKYEVVIGHKILQHLPALLPKTATSSRYCLVADRTVHSLYGSTLSSLLRDAGRQLLPPFEFIPGERSKTVSSLTRLLQHLASIGMCRNDIIIALGGGVTGDLAGFAAAIYMRGIPYIQIPTTLLAQADSSIGGKTGINLPQGKNLVGAFHAPLLVMSDLSTLDTLPLRHIRNGLAEIFKMAVIGDLTLFEFLETHAGQLTLSSDRSDLIHALIAACKQKCDIVERDEKESGIRTILNLGHTFAHGFECVVGYGKLLHGEAVGLGILAACRLAVTLSVCSEDLTDRVRDLLTALGLPTKIPAMDVTAVMDVMLRDKKSRSGTIRFVLPESIGRVKIVEIADIHATKNHLKQALND